MLVQLPAGHWNHLQIAFMLQLDFLPRALPLDTFLLGADGFGFPAEAGKMKQILYLLLPGRLDVTSK